VLVLAQAWPVLGKRLDLSFELLEAMFVKFSVVAALVALVNAAPKPMGHVVHEERTVTSRDWVKGARIEKDAIIPMRIGLTQTNLEKGYDYLMEV
jgi:tripeptidyl-peptidase-1